MSSNKIQYNGNRQIPQESPEHERPTSVGSCECSVQKASLHVQVVLSCPLHQYMRFFNIHLTMLKLCQLFGVHIVSCKMPLYACIRNQSTVYRCTCNQPPQQKLHSYLFPCVNVSDMCVKSIPIDNIHCY